MRIYIAGPLFNESERARNLELRALLHGAGHTTFLPQEDGTLAFSRIAEGAPEREVRREVFAVDVAEIKKCDLFLAVLDGRVPDEGMCVELGIAYALGKRCVGYKSDQRALDRYGDNLMIEGCLEATLSSKEEFEEYFKKIAPTVPA